MIRVAILTASDKGSRGERIDESGNLAEQLMVERGFEVVARTVLADEKELLTEQLIDWCDNVHIDLILTTGGTGFSKRDCMPEVTMGVIERHVPGIPEAMRYESLKITPRAMLSRGIAGIRKETLIINLPGSPKAVKENLLAVVDTVKHGVHILKGSEVECGQKVH